MNRAGGTNRSLWIGLLLCAVGIGPVVLADWLGGGTDQAAGFGLAWGMTISLPFVIASIVAMSAGRILWLRSVGSKKPPETLKPTAMEALRTV